MLLFLAFGGLWKDLKDRANWPSPEQTLKIVFTDGAPRSLSFSYI